MNWFVYILLCSDGSYYCGATNNLAKRLKAHNDGKGAKYTRARRPVFLFKYVEVPNKSAALKLEAKIKKLSHKQKECINVNSLI
jgi:putative endonuclease